MNGRCLFITFTNIRQLIGFHLLKTYTTINNLLFLLSRFCWLCRFRLIEIDLTVHFIIDRYLNLIDSIINQFITIFKRILSGVIYMFIF